MPPKQTDLLGQKNSDAMYIFDTLFHVTTPAVINVNEVAAQTGAKPNTIIKRFSIFRQRYPGLKIHTTVAPSTTSGSIAGAVPATPGPRRARPSDTRKVIAPKPAPKVAPRKNPKKFNQSAKSDDEEDDMGDTNLNDVGAMKEFEADTVAEVADDEATPAKKAQPKRKRAVSGGPLSIKAEPLMKKAKSTADRDKNITDDELSLVEILKTNKQDNSKDVGYMRYGDPPKAKTEEDKSKASTELDKGMGNIVSSSIVHPKTNSAPIYAATYDHEAASTPISGLITGGQKSGTYDDCARSPCNGDAPALENTSAYRPAHERTGDHQTHNILTEMIGKPTSFHTNSMSNTAFSADTDAFKSQMTAFAENRMAKLVMELKTTPTIDTGPTQETADLVVSYNTLLRRMNSTSTGNRIVGIDIGFNKLLETLSTDSTKNHNK